jgi:hypothetical protein
MKNQYIADIGDYGKYGLLRFLAGKGIKIGVNWYLTSDDGSSDGKFTGYLENEKERFRDPELFDSLRHIAGCPEKSVEMIQNEGLIPGACYYAEPIPCTGQDMRARRINRSLWFNNSTLYLHDAELIFADPDNGNTMVKKEGSKGIEKYTLPQELKEYYNHGHNVVYYCSKGRRKWEAWEDTKTEMQSVLPDCNIYALTFHKGTQRTYIFLIHPKDFQRYMRILSEFLRSSWKGAFTVEYINGVDPSDTVVSNELVIPLRNGKNISLSMTADGWVKITTPKGMTVKEKPDDFVGSFLDRSFYW